MATGVLLIALLLESTRWVLSMMSSLGHSPGSRVLFVLVLGALLQATSVGLATLSPLVWLPRGREAAHRAATAAVGVLAIAGVALVLHPAYADWQVRQPGFLISTLEPEAIEAAVPLADNWSPVELVRATVTSRSPTGEPLSERERMVVIARWGGLASLLAMWLGPAIAGLDPRRRGWRWPETMAATAVTWLASVGFSRWSLSALDPEAPMTILVVQAASCAPHVALGIALILSARLSRSRRIA